MAYVLIGVIVAAAASGSLGSVAGSREEERSPAPIAAAAEPTGLYAAFPHEASEDARERGEDPHASSTDPHRGMSSAHANAAQSNVPVKPVPRASGPRGRTVAEAIEQRTRLAGETVRIHATVVKSTPGILGRTYLHLRDGSGEAAAGTHDLTVTTEATPAVGETIVIEGRLAVDRDLGQGYRFSTIVDDATVLAGGT
jgi:hypothetical protein